MCLDLFQAGTETTSNTLSFGLIYMVHNIDVQTKARNELDRVIGRNRLPTLNDRPDLPYIDAILCEVQRMANVAPLGIVHRATETVKFGDYIIPKDAIMLVSLYSLNMDKDYWKDPFQFRPERFVDDEGKLIQHTDQFLPFGLGNLNCAEIKNEPNYLKLIVCLQVKGVVWAKIWPNQRYFYFLPHFCIRLSLRWPELLCRVLKDTMGLHFRPNHSSC